MLQEIKSSTNHFPKFSQETPPPFRIAYLVPDRPPPPPLQTPRYSQKAPPPPYPLPPFRIAYPVPDRAPVRSGLRTPFRIAPPPPPTRTCSVFLTKSNATPPPPHPFRIAYPVPDRAPPPPPPLHLQSSQKKHRHPPTPSPRSGLRTPFRIAPPPPPPCILKIYQKKKTPPLDPAKRDCNPTSDRCWEKHGAGSLKSQNTVETTRQGAESVGDPSASAPRPECPVRTSEPAMAWPLNILGPKEIFQRGRPFWGKPKGRSLLGPAIFGGS